MAEQNKRKKRNNDDDLPRSIDVTQPSKMVSDVHPSMQPDNTYRFALNAKLDNDNDRFILSSERSDSPCIELNKNEHVIGRIYVGDNQNVLFCHNAEANQSRILLADGECQYKTIINDAYNYMNFSLLHPIYGTYRLRKGCEKTIYFTDSYNPPRYLNITDPSKSKDVVPGDLFPVYADVNPDKLRLQKCYSVIPNINVEVQEGGKLKAGSYNFSIRYLDDDMNPSEWIYTTEPVIVFADKFNDRMFSDVRASSNDDKEYRKYGPTTKAIKVSAKASEANMDKSYMYVQFAMIEATSGTGAVSGVSYSPVIEIDKRNEHDAVFVFDNIGATIEGNIDDIYANPVIYDKAEWLEQADDRLVMANVTETDVDWCKLQKYASRITSSCVWDGVKLNDINSRKNHKNPHVLFNGGPGFQPGEIYSFGIVYVLENGVKSPVYHIPGRNALDKRSNMSLDNECKNVTYPELSMSCDGFSFWGYDSCGQKLAGNRIRHHRFPVRPADKMIVTETIEFNTSYVCHYNLITGIVQNHSISSAFKKHFNFIFVKYNINLYKDRQSAMGEWPSEGEIESFELHIDYNEFASGAKNVDVSEREKGSHLHPILYSSNPFKEGVDSYTNLPLYYNFVTGDHVDEGTNTEVLGHYAAGHTKNYKLKRGKQIKYINVYEYSLDDYYMAKFDKLQEYPQFVETDSDDIKKPRMFTTGSKITVAAGNKGWNQHKDENRTKTREAWVDLFESLGDDFFEMKYPTFDINEAADDLVGTSVKVLDLNNKNFYFQGSSQTGWKEYQNNGRRVVLMGNYNTNEDELEKVFVGKYNANSNRSKEEKLINAEYINTSIGFKVEVRIEMSQTVKDMSVNGYRCGISFSNIDIPADKYLNGHHVVGYHIVMNERTDNDATVIDSAVLTPLFFENKITQSQTYKSIVSSRLFTDDNVMKWVDMKNIFDESEYKTWNYLIEEQKNRTTNSNTDLTEKLFRNGVGFINPMFKFERAEYDFDKMMLAGYFVQRDNKEDERMIHYSTDFNEGWVIQDVQDGSSYNKSINSKKDKDLDGTDLHIYHKNSYVLFDNSAESEIYTIERENVHYLAPMTYIEKTINNVSRKVFNASYDNNMGFAFYLKKQNGDYKDVSELFSNTNNRTNRLPYVYLMRDLEDHYADFRTRAYFDVSGFTKFRQSKTIYNGDCFISPMKYTTGTLYDIRMKNRKKKDTVWQYVTGSALVAGGIATTVVSSIYTGGALNGIGAASVSAGISFIQNGINIDVAYKNRGVFNDIKGKNALTDKWVKMMIDKQQDDDEFQWLFESVDALWFESRLNINWRIGSAESSITDYLDPLSGYQPSKLREYFFNKLTCLDDKRDSGRSYLGMAQCEIYDINKDFQRRNREKSMYCLPATHECCSECENRFPNRIVYSQKSFSEERVDNYRNFKPGNHIDIPGETGNVTAAIFSGQDSFVVLTTEGAYLLPCTKQQISNPVTGVVSFIGTGDFFASGTRRLAYSDMNVSYGCNHKASIVRCPEGVAWYSDHDNEIYFQTKEGIEPITEKYGIHNWFKKNGSLSIDNEFYKSRRTLYPYRDNPFVKYGSGYVLGYDYANKRLLITKSDDSSVFNENLCMFSSKDDMRRLLDNEINRIKNMGYVNICHRWSNDLCGYIIDYDGINIGIDNIATFTDNREEFNATSAVFDDSHKWPDNSFTLSYLPSYGFISFHSYHPSAYIMSSVHSMVSYSDDRKLYRLESGSDFLVTKGKNCPFVVEIVASNINVVGPVISDCVSLYVEGGRFVEGSFVKSKNVFFDKLFFYNSRQCSNVKSIKIKDEIDGDNFFAEYTDTPDVCFAERRETYWHVNDIRDDVLNTSLPMLVEDRQSCNEFMFDNNMNGWIDKVPNKNVFGNKPWWDIEPFRDTYLCQRYFYNGTELISVVLNSERHTQSFDNTI